MRSQNKTVQNEHVILRRVSRIQEKVSRKKLGGMAVIIIGILMFFA